jgi:hypothetical protein
MQREREREKESTGEVGIGDAKVRESRQRCQSRCLLVVGSDAPDDVRVQLGACSRGEGAREERT